MIRTILPRGGVFKLGEMITFERGYVAPPPPPRAAPPSPSPLAAPAPLFSGPPVKRRKVVL